MRIIDLLNKIANREEMPKKIIYKNVTYEHDEKSEDYYTCYDRGLFEYLFKCCANFLNDEVEIIEEPKKIEKIDFGTLNTQKEKNKVMKDTINELIDEINNLKEKKEEQKD